MKQQQWMLWISIAIFSGLGIYYLLPVFVSPLGRSRLTGKAVKPLVASSAAGQLAAGKTANARGEGDERVEWGRNPFLTVEEAKGERVVTSGPEVKTIILGPAKPVATIGGKTVLVGEKVGDETVVEIRPDAVVLEKDGVKRIVEVREPSVSIQVKDTTK